MAAHGAPLVSVLLTVFNPQQEYFSAAVNSILTQTFVDFELIIVEGRGNTSGRQMIESDSRIRYFEIDQPTSLIPQKNIGTNHATGEFIAMMDADDISHPTRLQRQVDFLFGNPSVSMVGTQIVAINAKNKAIGYRRFPTEDSAIKRHLTGGVPFCHPSVMIRRKCLVDVGGYVDIGYSTCEDYDLWSRLASAGATFANLEEVLFQYRLHDLQMKSTHLRDTLGAMKQIRQLNGWQVSWPRRVAEAILGQMPRSLAYKLIRRHLYRDKPPATLQTSNSESVVPPSKGIVSGDVPLNQMATLNVRN